MKKDDFFKKAATERSMTTKIKTMKTADLDMGEGAASDFIDSMGEQGEDAGTQDNSRTKITAQQKVKYALHILTIVFFHLYVFWYVPIVGNL